MIWFLEVSMTGSEMYPGRPTRWLMASMVRVDFMSASQAPTNPSLLSWLKPRQG